MYGSESIDRAFTQVDEIAAAARAAAFTLEQLAASLGEGGVKSAKVSDGPSERWEELREENRQLREALDSRSAIERAKGVLMGRFGCTEREAFSLLVSTARRRQRKVRVIANELLVGVSFPEIEQAVAETMFQAECFTELPDAV